MTVNLELMTDDPEERQLAIRYWAMSNTGDFLEKVIDLVPFRHITHSGTLASHVRELCRAFDNNLTCPHCDACMEVKSRSAVKKNPQKSFSPCPACEEVQVRQKRAEQAAAAAALELRLNAYVERLPSGPIDYHLLGDDEALLLLALDLAISPRLISESFTLDECKALAPMDVALLIDKLKTAGVVREDPHSAAPGTYFLRDDNLMVNTHFIPYALVPDQHLGRTEEAMQILLAREFCDSAALFNLWLDFASADAVCYLLDKCRAFHHDLNENQLNEIRSTLRNGLRTHSVSQIWFVIWKNVKDAASLARLVYYTEVRATATIPGKIRRTLEKIEKEGSIVRKWDRPDYQPAGTLGMLFNELFGIDEDTPGSDVLARFAELQPEATTDSAHLPEAEAVRRLLYDALMNDSGPEMMFRFAQLIRGGSEIGSAIMQMSSGGGMTNA
ncbi:hypothetical protein ABDX87_23005 [Pseudomonas abietaniphila]|uniref:hypothetical protein n=1 Tax=Pseudomonas abietaniphila TaxID=89065 RepID=UPI0032166A0C